MFSIALAVSNDDVIGCYHNLLQKTKIIDGTFLSGVGVDAVVHPDYRKIGVYDRMSELIYDLCRKSCIEYRYTVSVNPILLKRNLRMGYPRFPHDVMIFVRIHDVNKHLQMIPLKNAWLKKSGFLLIKKLHQFKKTLADSSPIHKNFHISRIRSFSHEIDLLWDDVKNHYNFIVERTHDYLNWRYCDPRGGKYIVKQAEEDGRILGYIVTRVNRFIEGYPVGYIVDLLTLPGRLDVSEALLAEAVNHFDEEKINVVTGLVIRNHPNEKIFKKHGFVNSREKINIFFKKYRTIEEINKLKSNLAENIHFTCGDFDHI